MVWCGPQADEAALLLPPPVPRSFMPGRHKVDKSPFRQRAPTARLLTTTAVVSLLTAVPHVLGSGSCAICLYAREKALQKCFERPFFMSLSCLPRHSPPPLARHSLCLSPPRSTCHGSCYLQFSFVYFSSLIKLKIKLRMQNAQASSISYIYTTFFCD